MQLIFCVQFLSCTFIKFICNTFLVESLGYSICKIMSLTNNFTSSLPIWMSFFFFFPCLIVLVRNFSTMLNKSHGSGNLCLVPDHIYIIRDWLR